MQVLVLGVTPPPPLALEEALAGFAASGVTVRLVFTRDPATTLAGHAFEASKVVGARQGPASAPARFSLPWFSLVARNVLVRGTLRQLPARTRAWLAVRADREGRVWAAAADVIVALDRYAVYPAWRLGRRSPGATVVFGADAALREVRRRGAAAAAPGGAAVTG